MDAPKGLTEGFWPALTGWLRLFGFLSLLIVFIPYLLAMRLIDKARAERIPRQFHACLCRLLGLRVRVRGQVASDDGAPVIFVSNHSSYVDIPVLGSTIGACFVAKSEVAGWPLVGTLARLQRTIFIERRSSKAGKQRDVLRDCLDAGQSLIFFPEGTSSDGMRTLPFKSTLFSIAEKPLAGGRPVRIQPVSLLCTEIGGHPMGRSWRPYYAWYGDMTLVKHGWDLFKIADFTIDVIFHAPVTMDDFGNRKLMAEYCQRTIAEGVDQCVTGRFKQVAG